MLRLIPAVLMLITLVAVPVRAQHQHAHSVVMPETLKWVDPPVLPGAKLAVLQGDPSKEGLFVYRIKMPAAYKIPPHVHKASENVTVLTGSFFIGVGEKFDTKAGVELPVGGFVVDPAEPSALRVGGRPGNRRAGARRRAHRPRVRQSRGRPQKEVGAPP